MITVGWPATHDEVVTGMHAWGVRTPPAADVADATVGLDVDMHMLKEGMFTNGV